MFFLFTKGLLRRIKPGRFFSWFFHDVFLKMDGKKTQVVFWNFCFFW